MFENDVFDTWLDAKSKEIILKLDKEKLSSEEMIILMLKAQTNHFAHLDIDLRSDMAALNAKLSHDMSELNRELRQDMQSLNERLSKEMLELRKDMDKRFEQVDKRFEQVDKRFEQVDKRFEQVDKRFETLTTRIDRFMIWSFATTLAIGAGVVTAIRYLPAVQ